MSDKSADASVAHVLVDARTISGESSGQKARIAINGMPTLRFAAAIWWIVAAAGHVIFGTYIIVTYGAATLRGNAEAWNRVWPTGYVPDKPLGNLLVAIHVLLASVVALCGFLQLVPALRRRAPALHQWNGRIYASIAIIVGLAGLAMMANDRSFVGASQNGSVAINGVLLVVCAILAWQRARARDFIAHRRWALRLFVLAAGVWFFRIGLSAWIALNGGIVGFNPRTMQGPALLALAIGEWAVPLLVLEVYLRVERARGAIGRYIVATLLMTLTAATGFGVYRATIGMWLPLMLAR